MRVIIIHKLVLIAIGLLTLMSCEKDDSIIYGDVILTEEERDTHRVVCDIYVNDELMCRKITIEEYRTL